MPLPILTTKLFIPPPRSNLVFRQRLINRLNTGLSRKLTLISAPAGFGKSTLLSACIQQIKTETRIAWLSLDESDNDLTRFLTYFVAALQTVESDIGQGVLTALPSLDETDAELILSNLINEVNLLTDDIILVLDDYHVIETPTIDQAITFLLDHLPTQLHLVIASRIDPSLPLSRLRARGQMIEIRADDLRFTLDEAIAFLNQVMSLNLSTQDVTSLEERTEGWIAGLQLAALSLRGFVRHSDITAFVNRFTGSDRYIQDYLVDEVLQQQPQESKDFLLQTSILKRLSGSLCDSVRFEDSDSDGTASQEILKNLEAANLFIVPLDNERRWYRYHHLFADLLRQRLRQTYPELMPELHSRASHWYEQNDLPGEAIRHALASNDPERAASLAELVWPNWHGSYQSITWLGWVQELPCDLVRVRPVLSLGYAWAFMNAGKLDEAETYLRNVERWLEPVDDTHSSKMVVVDEDQFEELPISVATARAYHAQAIGDVAGTEKYAQRVLDLIPAGDSYDRGTVTALLGLSQWSSGNLEAAHRTFSDGLANMEPLDIIVGTFVLTEIMMTLGHLHEAVNTSENALRLAAENNNPIGTEDVYIGLSELHRELGNLEAAAQDLETAQKLAEQIELPDWQHRWCIAQARLKHTLGDPENALALSEEAERLYVQTPLPIVRPFAALKARIWIRQGRLIEVHNWARERGLSVDDELSYLQEFEHITLARLLSAQHQIDQSPKTLEKAAILLKRLLKAAQEGQRTTSAIEILVLLALTYEFQEERSSAIKYLEQALILAEPEGYVRIFVDEGPVMAKLLSATTRRGIRSEYVGKLMGVIEGEKGTQQPPLLIDPLSARELEVLELVAQGLSNRQIGERLFLALDTIKGYNRKVFSKLGVKNRTQAVKKAISLKIISPQ